MPEECAFKDVLEQEIVNGTAGDSRRVSVTVARNGDLVGDIYVELKVKASGIDEAGVCWVAVRVLSTMSGSPLVVSASTSSARSGSVCARNPLV